MLRRVVLKMAGKRLSGAQQRALKKAIAASAKKRAMKKGLKAAKLSAKVVRKTKAGKRLQRSLTRSQKRLARAQLKSMKINRRIDRIKNPSGVTKVVRNLTGGNSAAAQARRLEKATRLQLRATSQAKKVERLAMRNTKNYLKVVNNQAFVQKASKNIDRAKNAEQVALKLLKQYSK